MMDSQSGRKTKTKDKSKHNLGPFRRAVLRGLTLLLPPLLTLVIFVWVINTVNERLLIPVKEVVQNTIVWQILDIQDEDPELKDAEGVPVYKELGNGKYILRDVYIAVEKDIEPGAMPEDAREIYLHYVQIRYLQWETVIPIFLCGFLLILYLLGKFLAAGIGRFFWNSMEQIIHRLPIIRNVYGSVKQVTDFVFSEREIEYTRVVAVEYPRKGIWSLGFVTGESMLDIRSAANEPVISVLMPTSPMPATGFTVTVRKSETVDLNITVEQAFQFIVSCGVVVPSQQQHEISSSIMAALSEKGVSNNGSAAAASLSAPRTTTKED